MDDLVALQAKIAKARYLGLSYLGCDGDPIPLPETVNAGIGRDSPESIDRAFKEILKTAERNGMSAAELKKIA